MPYERGNNVIPYGQETGMGSIYDSNPHENMMKSQILTGHVLEQRLLDALMGVDREPFLPELLRGSAYVDEDLPLGDGRYLMETLAFARLLKYAALEAHETVLDVGSGAGYSAAVISKMVQKVVALEEDASLLAWSKPILKDYPNVELVSGLLVEGASRQAPYDAIIIEGAIEFLPAALGDQLREGGRLLTVEHDAKAHMASAGLGKLVEYKKLRAGLYKNVVRDANVALLPSFQKPQTFSL
jgi:protein-L-isoaspartate(D-aspartate) O-methyltransferase